MIALCREHHDKADDSFYTKEQFLNLKKNPVINSKNVSEEYSYLRRNTVCFVGGSLGYDTKYILMIDEEPVIWFELDEMGYDRLSLLIKDSQGNVILYMDRNDWITPTRNVFDIECSARGKTLKVISRDKKTDFELRFDDLKVEEFKRRMLELGHNEVFIDKLVPKILQDIPGQISMWTLMGNIAYKDKTLKMNEDIIKYSAPPYLSDLSISNNIAVHCNVFLKAGSKSFAVGVSSSPFTLRQYRQRMKELEELETLEDDALIYLRAGSIYFITNRNNILENFKYKK